MREPSLKLPGYDQGWWSVQDASAQLVGQAAQSPARRPGAGHMRGSGGKGHSDRRN